MAEDQDDGIPEEVKRQVDINQEDDEKTQVTPVVEKHQIKLPIPSHIRMEIGIQKGQKVSVWFDRDKNQIIYQL